MAEELTDAERDELHADLLALRDALGRTVATTAQAAETVQLDQAAVGRVSRIDAIQRQRMAEAQQRRNALRQKQIDVALKYFAEGEYGWCRRCGDPVGYRRLKARPESPACVPCMSALEEERG